MIAYAWVGTEEYAVQVLLADRYSGQHRWYTRFALLCRSRLWPAVGTDHGKKTDRVSRQRTGMCKERAALVWLARATCYSVIAVCILVNVERYEYLRQLLTVPHVRVDALDALGAMVPNELIA